jgi:hypothetical protein
MSGLFQKLGHLANTYEISIIICLFNDKKFTNVSQSVISQIVSTKILVLHPALLNGL